MLRVEGILKVLRRQFSRISTPTLLQLLLGTTWLSILFFWIAAYTGIEVCRTGLQQTGRNANYVATQQQQVKALLEAMDTSAIRLLLVSSHYQDSSVENAVRTTYDERRSALADTLILDAQYLAANDRDRALIVQLQAEMGRYDVLVGRAFALQELSTTDAERAKAHQAYALSRQKLDDVILPTADQLQTATDASLATANTAQYAAQKLAASKLAVSGTILLVVLCLAQWVLFQRTRRFINSGLGMAMLCAVALFWGTATSFGVNQQMSFATNSNFGSLRDIATARALAYSTEADESRAFLEQDVESRRSTLNAFNSKMSSLQDLISKRLGDDYKFHLYRNAHQLLVDKLKNDQRDEAINTLFSPTSTSVDETFHEVDVALTDALNTSQNTFDTSLGQGINFLSNRERITSLIALTIAFCAFLGIVPRLKEYAF